MSLEDGGAVALVLEPMAGQEIEARVILIPDNGRGDALPLRVVPLPELPAPTHEGGHP